MNYKALRAEEAIVALDTPWQKLCRLGEPLGMIAFGSDALSSGCRYMQPG